MEAVQMLATEDSFDAHGVLIPAGHIGTFDKDRLNGKETHLHDASLLGKEAIVEIAAVGPTGPNPRIPQQLPPGAVQGPGGEYMLPGKRLVGEATDPAEQRLDDRGLRDADHEAKVTETLSDLMGTPATTTAATEGTVAEVTADLGAKTNDQLETMLAAEKSGSNRKGVTSAIQAELDSREEKA